MFVNRIVETMPGTEEPVAVKRRRRNLRVRRRSGSPETADDGDDAAVVDRLQQVRAEQQSRKRANGVDAETLLRAAADDPDATAKEAFLNDPFKAKSGGLVDLESLRKHKIKMTPDQVAGLGMGHNFAAESGAGDEESDMLRYVEEKMVERRAAAHREAQRQRRGQADGTANSDVGKAPTTAGSGSTSARRPDDALQRVSEKLRRGQVYKTEDLLSDVMLTGIPEVELGLEAKLANIEATETAKKRLLQEVAEGKKSAAAAAAAGQETRHRDVLLVPHNMSTNYVQHQRFSDVRVKLGVYDKDTLVT